MPYVHRWVGTLRGVLRRARRVLQARVRVGWSGGSHSAGEQVVWTAAFLLLNHHSACVNYRQILSVFVL
jgi:hypothetical protein